MLTLLVSSTGMFLSSVVSVSPLVQSWFILVFKATRTLGLEYEGSHSETTNFYSKGYSATSLNLQYSSVFKSILS